MIDIDSWINLVLEKLKIRFGKNLLFVGLQGSYSRGEATENSDIDLIVVLNNLNFEDLKIYHSILNEMPSKDKSCGFISGKKRIRKMVKIGFVSIFL